MPGEKGFVMIEFDPKNRSKVFHKSVRVTTNGNPREAVLRIKGYIIPDPTNLRKRIGNLQVTRAEFNFSEILDTETKLDSIMIKNDGKAEMSLKIEKDEIPPNMEIIIAQPELEVGETTFIHSKIWGDKTGKYGFSRARVKFWDDNNPEKTLGNIQISYSQKEDFSAWTNEQKSQAPGLRFKQTTYNFGKASYTEDIVCEFSFSNPGKSKLIIRDIRLSSFVEILSYDESVPAGGEGKLILKINLKRAVGDFIRYVTVITNCPTRSSKRLTIKGKVIDK